MLSRILNRVVTKVRCDINIDRGLHSRRNERIARATAKGNSLNKLIEIARYSNAGRRGRQNFCDVSSKFTQRDGFAEHPNSPVPD